MSEFRELPIMVIDDEDEYKLKEYMNVNGLSYFVGKTTCECNEERNIYLFMQTPYIIISVIVCNNCYNNNKYRKLKL